ncbi:hypothetical protein [Streptomyces sp. WAC 01529]|uniref:YunG family protein n=1 Tax=Streptomyces sp. WAC 01529 TaxID=2203205 RepID=UPI001F0C757B|nr:hypothetical protein [Streptomyces sp. WAC 01529]
MTPVLLSDIETAVRESWGADTADPGSSETWPPDNPERDQCGVTALVVNDLLGGDLMLGEVHVDGERTGYHWWNRLASGMEIDLTRGQFLPGETLTDGVPLTRPPEIRRCREEYELLRGRVLKRLDALARDRECEVSRTEASAHWPDAAR